MQRAVPFFSGGKPPKPPKKALLSIATLSSLRSRGLTHNHTPAAPWLAQGAFGVAHRQPGAGVACGQPRSQREGGSVWQIFTLEQLKSHSWNIAKKPPTHRSVGRYRQGIIGYNCPCVSYGITHRHKTAHTAPTSLC